MKAIWLTRVARRLAWPVTMAVIMPTLLLGLTPTRAQSQQVLKVIMADFVNKANGLTDDPVAKNATAAVYNELANSGQGRFDVIPEPEVLVEAKSAGLRVPSNPNTPAAFSLPDLLRLAKRLQADAIVRGDVAASPPMRGKPAMAAISVTIEDVASEEITNGGLGEASVAPMPGQPAAAEDLMTKAVENAAQLSVQKIVQRQIPLATVMNISGNMVIMSRGLRDGIKVGDELVIEREGENGTFTKEGLVKVARAYATDSEADVIQNIGGIRPEDEARVLYQPQYVITPNLTLRPSQAHTRLNFSAMGATLSAIGLGVLLTVAGRGGQASVTNVVAEPTSDNVSAAVRITWSDNIFGQGGVQEYHMWRLPDFPFDANLATGAAGNNGTGNNNNNLVIGRLPIANVIGLSHTYTDRPSPFAFYLNGATLKIGVGNGGVGTGTNNQNNQNQNVTCGFLSVTSNIPTGFTPGTTYQYQVSAVILRQQVIINGGTQGGGGTNGNFICIETDPVTGGNSTPVVPPILLAPAAQSAAVNIKQFTPSWTSETGADVFQVEVSTDRLFSSPTVIAHFGPLFSSSPNASGVTQTVPAAIDLTTQAPLLSDPNFANFVNGVAGAQPPQIFWRVGGRHDEDQPGPVDWFASDSDRTFRWVYSPIQSFTPAQPPPPPPSRKAIETRGKVGTSQVAPPPGSITRTVGSAPPRNRTLPGHRGVAPAGHGGH